MAVPTTSSLPWRGSSRSLFRGTASSSSPTSPPSAAGQIRLVPTDTAALAGDPCGLWLASDDEDVILHETGTSDYHIDQIVCHEIGHMLLGHGRGHADDAEQPAFDRLDELLPDIDRATVRAILGRTDFRADQERDAEMFASMIMIAAAEGAAKKSVLRSIFLNRQ